jgi:hypothetical protein
MKKFIYIAIIAILGSFAVTSCTEENVKPSIDASGKSNPSGCPSIDKLKD